MAETFTTSLTKLIRLQQAIQRNCCERKKELVNMEEVIAKTIKAFDAWAQCEQHLYGNNADIYAMIQKVLDAMRSGSITVDYIPTKKQLEEAEQLFNNQN